MPEVLVVQWAAASLAIAMVALWLLSLALRDASIVDIFWGLGFVMVAWLTFALGGGVFERRLLVAVLTTVWGGRLAGYLAWRNHGRGEDARYAAMRQHHGAAWPLRSLFIVFGLQGVLVLIISLPLQVAGSQKAPPLGVVDVLGALIVLGGVVFEATGDLQLARFKAKPEHRGQVMQTGLWRYTRHPNYFGDFCVWWGLWLVAAGTGLGAWTIVSPLVMSWLLMRVSGVPMLERVMSERPGYAEYLRRTSAFFPRPPRA